MKGSRIAGHIARALSSLWMLGIVSMQGAPVRAPVIDVTDLYHPYQDVGDNFDLIAAYALPEVDLRAVVLDVTEAFRKPVADHPGMYPDPKGPREPGFIQVHQLNYIFNRNLPCGTGPFSAMKSPSDKMAELPAFQQQGVELILRTLRESREKVHILSFGSARPVAVAYNREPKLFRRKVARIHLCAGSSSPEFLEWNVQLDPHAIVCLLRSDLPVAIYPCGTKDGAFAYGPHNCFWQIADLEFVRQMAPPLRRYLAYSFNRSSRIDFLRAVEEAGAEEFAPEALKRPHNVWETCVWLEVTNRKLVRRADGHCRIIPASEILATDQVLPNDLRPCRIHVQDSGRFTFEMTKEKSNFLMYDRADPKLNERALREALPALYLAIRL